jgi:hypothetical protein
MVAVRKFTLALHFMEITYGPLELGRSNLVRKQNIRMPEHYFRNILCKYRRESSVGRARRLWARGMRNRGSIPGGGKIFFSSPTVSTLALGPTQSRNQCRMGGYFSWIKAART